MISFERGREFGALVRWGGTRALRSPMLPVCLCKLSVCACTEKQNLIVELNEIDDDIGARILQVKVHDALVPQQPVAARAGPVIAFGNCSPRCDQVDKVVQIVL